MNTYILLLPDMQLDKTDPSFYVCNKNLFIYLAKRKRIIFLFSEKHNCIILFSLYLINNSRGSSWNLKAVPFLLQVNFNAHEQIPSVQLEGLMDLIRNAEKSRL